MLLSEGHADAWRYPLGMLWDEQVLVVERLNRREATRATLLQSAVSGVLSKEANKAFSEIIKDLDDS
jgi:hypothetical protein